MMPPNLDLYLDCAIFSKSSIFDNAKLNSAPYLLAKCSQFALNLALFGFVFKFANLTDFVPELLAHLTSKVPVKNVLIIIGTFVSGVRMMCLYLLKVLKGKNMNINFLILATILHTSLVFGLQIKDLKYENGIFSFIVNEGYFRNRLAYMVKFHLQKCGNYSGDFQDFPKCSVYLTSFNPLLQFAESAHDSSGNLMNHSEVDAYRIYPDFPFFNIKIFYQPLPNSLEGALITILSTKFNDSLLTKEELKEFEGSEGYDYFIQIEKAPIVNFRKVMDMDKFRQAENESHAILELKEQGIYEYSNFRVEISIEKLVRENVALAKLAEANNALVGYVTQNIGKLVSESAGVAKLAEANTAIVESVNQSVEKLVRENVALAKLAQDLAKKIENLSGEMHEKVTLMEQAKKEQKYITIGFIVGCALLIIVVISVLSCKCKSNKARETKTRHQQQQNQENQQQQNQENQQQQNQENQQQANQQDNSQQPNGNVYHEEGNNVQQQNQLQQQVPNARYA